MEMSKTQIMVKKPLLLPVHFDGLLTKLTARGLQFNEVITPYDRESFGAIGNDSFAQDEKFLALLTNFDTNVRVALNPTRPSALKLKQHLLSVQKKSLPDERIAIGHDFPETYDRSWHSYKDELGLFCESQTLIGVAFNERTPVGFFNFDVKLCRCGAKELDLQFSFNMVYVSAEARGKGYGFSLSIAASLVCADILQATYKAVRSGTEISISMLADYESSGGEKFVLQVENQLNVVVDDLNEFGDRPSISVKFPELSASH